MVIKSKDVIEEDFGAIKVKNIFHPKNIQNFSVAIVRVVGMNRRHINKRSDAFFYVLAGNGSFTIGDEVNEVEAGDGVFIPKGTTYLDSGQMTVLVVSSPRYDDSEIAYLE